MMVRLVLILCYAFSALPGPGLCCCTFRAPKEPQADSPVAESCCSCCRAESPAPVSENEPDAPSCGCRENHTHEATIASPAEPPPLPETSFDLPVLMLPLPTIAAEPAAPILDQSSRMLRVFHVLRC